MALLLLIVIVATLVVAAMRSPRDSFGCRAILSSYNVVLGLYLIYVVVPGTLVLLNGGKYTWASRFTSDSNFALTLALCELALLCFLFGNWLSRVRRGAIGSWLPRTRRSHFGNWLSRVRRGAIGSWLPRTRRSHFGNWLSSVRRSRPTSSSVGSSIPPQPRTTPLIVPVLLILVGLALKIYVIGSTGGFGETILRLSSGAKAAEGINDLDATAIALRTLSGMADAGAIYLFIRALRDRKGILVSVLLLLVVLGLSYIGIGKRLTVLMPIFAILIAYHVYVRRLTTKAAPLALAAVLLVGMGSLFFRIFIPALMAGINIDLDKVSYSGGSVFSFYFYSLEFSTVEMMTVSMQASDQILNMFGGAWSAFWVTSIEPFAYVVPRAIWPDKPSGVLDLSYGVSAVVNGTHLQDSTIGYASTLVGTSFIIAGVTGVIAAMFLFGWVAGKVDKVYSEGAWTIERVLAYALTLVLVFHFFRQGTLGWTFIVSIVQQLGFLLGFAILLLSRKKPEQADGMGSKYALSRDRLED